MPESVRARKTNGCGRKTASNAQQQADLVGLAGSGGGMREWCGIGGDLTTDAGDN